MRKSTIIIVVLLILLGIWGVSFVVGTSRDVVSEATVDYVVDEADMYNVSLPALDTGDTDSARVLTAAEEQWLVHMREEEKLARDVYTTLGDMWNARIFFNIAASEQTHTDAVKALIAYYGIDDPVTDDTVGVFTIPEMQLLYNTLVAQGDESLLEALRVGATIEDLDISDLDAALIATNKEDIRTVYANLQKGSRNHLRAFVKNITMQGGDYTPAYISPTAYSDILSSSQERGRVQ